MFALDEVSEAREAKFEQSPGGVDCRFIKMNDKWGVKLYYDEAIRDSAMVWQDKAAAAGLGPVVGDAIELPIDDDKIYVTKSQYRFGYVTEVIRAIEGSRVWKTSGRDKWYDKHRDEMSDYRQALKKAIGFTFYDAHAFNWGYKDGKLMCLDFGGNTSYSEPDYS